MEKREQNTKLLLQQIAIGDNKAFRTFYDQYYLQVYRFTSYYIKSSKLIEEIVSDVFCTIWQNRKKIPGIDNFAGYLYTITKNRALYYLEQENKRWFTETDLIPEDFFSDHETPEFIAIDKEFSDSLRLAINNLPERCRLIFLMSREEGLKYKEIARILSISEKTVNVQMVLAIKKLSKQLGKILFFII